jgi:hypothetical protein
LIFERLESATSTIETITSVDDTDSVVY